MAVDLKALFRQEPPQTLTFRLLGEPVTAGTPPSSIVQPAFPGYKPAVVLPTVSFRDEILERFGLTVEFSFLNETDGEISSCFGIMCVAGDGPDETYLWVWTDDLGGLILLPGLTTYSVTLHYTALGITGS